MQIQTERIQRQFYGPHYTMAGYWFPYYDDPADKLSTKDMARIRADGIRILQQKAAKQARLMEECIVCGEFQRGDRRVTYSRCNNEAHRDSCASPDEQNQWVCHECKLPGARRRTSRKRTVRGNEDGCSADTDEE